MCEAMRYVEEKYRKEGVKIGEEKRLEEIIRNALSMNLPTEIIQKLTGCSTRKIRAIERAFGA